MKAALVFLAMLIGDSLWAKWMLATSKRQPVPAAAYSSAIILVGGFTAVAYVNDPRYLIPAALGAFVGTYVTVRRG
jgi:hypothetical protein